MLKSMYSGISGMKSNQTKMDVVGNNIANSSTTAFKKSSVRFSDTLNKTVIYSSQPSKNVGGVNPGHVGIGVKVSSIAKNMLQGSLQQTGIPSDLSIDGEGFFIAQIDKSNKGKDENIITEGYTRDGSFTLDKDGHLVTSAGYYILNTVNEPVNIPTVVDKNGDAVKEGTEGSKRVLSYNISREGRISYVVEDGTKVDSSQTLKIATFVNKNGLEPSSGNIYLESSNSGAPEYNIGDNKTKHGLITQGALEMSNVDLSEEFTDMIVTTRAFQASSKVITTSDELLQEIINLKR
ncbi:flagellar hook-basal body complex protein [Clostridium sp. D53t1_180928_C8]|uniref:flagellar hook-basal body complex protein n=1 Tax=Clostridium sp. D53t1_180928_C8 TaxID=2787101 RepID=UPI0018AAD8A1|nr:flagellar hook-basal body complex protein [Clostridium sp. D53t1_180928_C8]